MSILDTINRATELVDEGIRIFGSVHTEVNDVGSAINQTDLTEAKARLEASLQRAQTAHDQLNAAIDRRLAAGG